MCLIHGQKIRAFAIVALLLTAGCSDSTRITAAGIPAPSARAQSFPVLTATRGANPGIYDSEGRFVLLRGVNYTALGDYYMQYPDSPTPIPPKANDFPEMAALGMNSIRLILHWSAIEPAPGQYDENYLTRVREQIELAAASGLYVILDMHQDAWGKFISSRDLDDAAFCIPPLAQAVGWDGAPQWATLTDGMLSCRLAQRELSGATAQAFTNFYLDRNGIQTRYIAMWQQLVSQFADFHNIAGYDLFNEPHPGYMAGGNVALLTSFYGKLITAIRSAEQSTAGKLSHIVFFEPGIEWSLAGEVPTVPPNFTSDSNIVFAPHNYCGTFNPLPPSQCFANAQTHADIYQSTYYSGEWGFYGDLSAAAPLMIEYARLEDANRVGGAFWVWVQACGDPHSLQPLSPTAGGIGAVPGETISVNRLKCPGDIPDGRVEEYTLPLSRAYPRAAPGRLLSLAADVISGGLTLTGQTNQRGQLSAWLPTRTSKPKITASGLSEIEVTPVPGGYSLTATASVGNYSLTVSR